MGKFLKKHTGILIIIVIALVFPVSMTNQARLNNRIIVTGLAIDKNGDKYEVTAQVVKPSPSSESSGAKAEINFLSDSDESIVSAIEKISYKSGKVASFSHTNFVLIGKNCLDDDITQLLDYFVRNKTIKSSSLLLFAEDNAADEIKKTKNMELSVGLGLQKVFLVKENEGDSEMTTIINFLKKSKSKSHTSTASTLKLITDKEQAESQSNGDSQSEESGQSSEESKNTGNSTSGSSGGNSSEKENYYFQALSPIVCYSSGKFVGKLESADEVTGYMIAKPQALTEDISLKNVNGGRFEDAKIGIKVNHKNVNKKIRFENQMPCLDIKISIMNSEIEDLQNNTLISELDADELDIIKQEIKKYISSKISACFEKSKQIKADVFGAYDIAYKFHYKDTNKYYDTMTDFLDNLKLNVEVDIVRVDY